MDPLLPLARHVFGPLLLRRRGVGHLGYWREIASWERLPPNEIQRRQWEKVKAVLIHAYAHTRYYRDVFLARGLTPEDIETPADLERLPVLTRSDVIDHGEEMRADNIAPGDLVPAETGGTSGIRMRFWRDRRCLARRIAGHLAFNRWYGHRPGCWQAAIWRAVQDMSPVTTLKSRIVNALAERAITLNAAELDEASMRSFASKLQRTSVGLVRAYTQAAYIFAAFCLEKGLRVSFPSLVCTAEPLVAEWRRVFKRAFGCDVFDEYGGRECGLMATECRHHNGMHVNASSVYVEVVREGRPCPPGEIGAVIVTDLDNYGMPLIRYDVEDAGVRIGACCPCGIGLPLLRVEGKTRGLMATTDGRYVSAGTMDQDMLDVGFPGAVQFVQDALDHVVVRYVAVPELRSDHLKAVQQKVLERLGDGIRIEMCEVEALPRAFSGKYQPVLSSVGPSSQKSR